MPLPEADGAYLFGVFLVGAYQEVLGDIHNLFGNTDVAHVRLTNTGFEIQHVTAGSAKMDVLHAVGYSVESMLDAYRIQMENADFTEEERRASIMMLENSLRAYTYFEEVPCSDG